DSGRRRDRRRFGGTSRTNVLLAEIYSQALESTGAEVTRQFNIGSREIYYDQVGLGCHHAVPESTAHCSRG
ncbi:hypothetical protein AK37_00065, partial [Rhodococcus pyridinivorans AK37]